MNSFLIKIYSKLHPGDLGTPCHSQDVTVVVDTGSNIKWKKVTYEN